MTDRKTSQKVVDATNYHQGLLPRRIIPHFRLPKQGETVAESHANVNAYPYKSALCVRPFMSFSKYRGAHPRTSEALFYLMDLVLPYLRLHHYVRQLNTLPWFAYCTVKEDVGSFIR